jgi:hypothetical protein
MWPPKPSSSSSLEAISGSPASEDILMRFSAASGWRAPERFAVRHQSQGGKFSG